MDFSLSHHVQLGHGANPGFFSLKVKLPEYEAHPSLLAIKEEVSTLIQMYNQQHIK
jgi:hypothetical protein